MPMRWKTRRDLRAREKLDQVLEIGEVLLTGVAVSRKRVSLCEVVELPVAGTDFPPRRYWQCPVPEVVGLVNNKDIRLFLHGIPDFLREVAAAHKVGMVEDLRVLNPLRDPAGTPDVALPHSEAA